MVRIKHALDIFQKDNLKELVETVTPILISPHSSSLTISLSKRFFLVNLMKQVIKTIEDDPHQNLIALLKSYKLLGRILTGTVEDFYRDRFELYFKNFFMEKEVYRLIKDDLEDLYPKYKHIRMTITKRGVILYDNYNKHKFNVLLMTIHSGTWVPANVQKKMRISKQDRFREEDVGTNMLYCNLVLDNAGIWIDNKQSRFVVDFNRPLKRAIYADNSEPWAKELWKEQLTKREMDDIISSYKEFYFTLSRLLETYQFNIIFDAHSMKHLPGRPNISFGTQYIPKFYMPIVRSMLQKISKMGYNPSALNNPYKGGNILRWLNIKFPQVFIFSMEINKKLYMNQKRDKIIQKRANEVSEALSKIFDLEDLDEQ